MPRGRPSTSDTSSTLEEQLSYNSIKSFADTRSFSAGEDYFASGAVSNLAVLDNRVTATVRGTSKYRVKLTAAPRGLDYDCSCPYASDEGAFCKHCVAVAIAYQREHLGAVVVEVDETSANPRRVGKGSKGSTLADLKEWLYTRSLDETIQMILERATDDEEWRNRLFLKVASDAKNGVDIRALRRIITKATETRRFNEYEDHEEMYEFVSGMEEIAKTLRTLVVDGNGKVVQDLAIYAVDRLSEVLQVSDDYNGDIAGVTHDFIEIHRDACVQSPPDPRQLAQELYDRELSDDRELWDDTPSFYAEALGEVGIAAFRKLLEEDWDQLPALTSKTGGTMRWESCRYRITHLMESLARAANDTDALVNVMRKDLSTSYHYLEIATVLKEAGRLDEALQWAEQGAKEFASNVDSRLEDFLVAEYKRRGDHDKSLKILWDLFLTSPNRANFITLHDYTEPMGGWQAWRDNAVDHLNNKLAEEKSGPKPSYPFYSRGAQAKQELIAIYLWEKNPDAAWELAKAEGCDDAAWKEIAFAREHTHPEDSLSVYKRLIPPLIEPVTNGQYEQPVELIAHVRKAMRLLDRDREFREYVAELRSTFKRKRNFLLLLDKRGF
jgi:uncharacterized Zn finger protein